MLDIKNLHFLIKRIKAATGLTQGEIAKQIHYSRAHFSTMKGNNSEELFDLLSSHFAEALNSKQMLEKAEKKYDVPDDELNEERAMIQVLFDEVAKLKSKALNISFDDAIDELMQNTKIALRQYKRKV